MDQIATSETTLPAITGAKPYFRVLDGWRGIAALLVAIFHLNVFSAIYSLDFMRNAYLFVDFFFVLSGFVITQNYGDRLFSLESVGAFTLRRLGRLWPLHVVVLLAFIGVEAVKAFSVSRGASFDKPPFSGETSPGAILTNLVFGQSVGIEKQLTWNPPSWSISAEFWTYLVFAAALFVASRWMRRTRFASEIFITAILVGSASVLVMFSEHGMDATYDLGLARCIYGFLVGHLTYRLWKISPPIVVQTRFLEPATLIVIAGFVSMAGHSGYSFLAPLVFAFVVFVFAFEAGPVSRLMSNKGNEWLGRISYSVYMWQAFVILNFVNRPISMIEKITGHVLTVIDDSGSALGNEAVKMIALDGHVLPIALTLLYIGILVVMASASYALIEKPGQKLFAHVADRLGILIRDRRQNSEAAESIAREHLHQVGTVFHKNVAVSHTSRTFSYRK
jgi:peptidoglycan/LPS O-acetylase OafA/YrhL